MITTIMKNGTTGSISCPRDAMKNMFTGTSCTDTSPPRHARGNVISLMCYPYYSGVSDVPTWDMSPTDVPSNRTSDAVMSSNPPPSIARTINDTNLQISSDVPTVSLTDTTMLPTSVLLVVPSSPNNSTRSLAPTNKSY
jgi:hypothetical protein